MTFIPLNQHLEVAPIEQDSAVAQLDNVYEEKGTVITSAEDCNKRWKAGDIVYFDSWLVARYEDSEGKKRYLVPESAIRAYEQNGIE